MGHHDAFFKYSFGAPEHAAGELRSILPADLASKIDLESLDVVPGSFVDDELAERHVDLLFRTRLHVGSTAYVYLLLEHQSEPDALMPWRILVYMIRIWQKHLRESPDARSLPLIIPLVIHHGEQGWTAPRRLHELFDDLDVHPFLGSVLPDFELLIDDLVHRDDAELRARPLPAVAKLTLWVLRDARIDGRLAEHVRAWTEELRQVASAPDLDGFIALMRYIANVGGRATFEEIRSAIAREVPHEEAAMITAAESFRQEGFELGKTEGKLEGKAEGVLEGMRVMVRRAFETRFGTAPHAFTARVASASEAELSRLLERVVVAASRDEITQA